MKKKIVIFGLLLFAVHHLSFSQNAVEKQIKGTLLDDLAEPLMFASIQVISKKGLRGTESDFDGNFKINILPGDSLRFSYIGYQSLVKAYEELSSEENNFIILDSKGITIQEVVVAGLSIASGCHLRCCYHRVSQKTLVRRESLNLSLNLIKRNWQYFPNPTSDYVQIDTKDLEGTIRLFSMEGKELKRHQINDALTKINLQGLPAGQYILRYDNDGWADVIGQVVKATN